MKASKLAAALATSTGVAADADRPAATSGGNARVGVSVSP
jgi:hypothetical protein